LIVDSSAILAILFGESEEKVFSDKILKTLNPKMSVANYLEVTCVLENRKNVFVSKYLDAFFDETRIQLMPVTVTQIKIAREAFRDFGKGSKSKAKLNFGDCFAYALAKEIKEPLLFKGNDFIHTDVRSA
jgi:ribonuclease VapC